MSLRSPKSKNPDYSRRGFEPLNNPNQSIDSNRNMAYDSNDGIPLTQVRTAGSTGARKIGTEAADLSSTATFNENTEGNEKKGFFHSHTHSDKKPGGMRKLKKLDSKNKRVGKDGEEVAVNGLGRIYNKVINFSVVTRYLVYVLPVAALIAIPIIIYAVLNPNAILGSLNVRVWIFWLWIEIVWLSLWIAKLVAQGIPFVFMFLMGVVSSGTRKYALILKAVEIPLSLVGWAVASLVTFTALMRPELNQSSDHPDLPQKRWVNVVKNLLGPALIASIIFLIEKMIIQLISVNYHRRSFANRIKESKHQIHLLGLLYEASRTLFPMFCKEFTEEDYVISDSIELMLGSKNPASRKSGNATPLRLIGNIGRVGDKVTSVFGNIASEITGKQVFNPNSAHSVVIEALEKTRSSEALAKRIWMSFVCEGRDALYAEDIEEVLGPARKHEADDAFSSLDNDSNGDISLDEMIMKVVDIGRDRKAMAASMRDVGQAIGVLDSVLCVVIFVIIIFIFVAFQNTNFVTTLATAGTTLLSLSFVFAVSVQEFLGSCIFLFVKHPYDVGDRVDIVGPSGNEFLVVEQISLLYTVFKRIDNMKVVQVPNIVLNTVWVENVTRSKAMKEQLEMFISFDTSLEDIDLLRTEMENFVRHPDNSRDFQPDLLLEATGIGSMDKLQLRVEIRHKSNWHNETVRAARRSKFMCALVLALRKVPIYAPGGGNEALGGPTNPGYSVTIDDTWAAEARAKAKKDKEEKRLVPTPAADTGKSSGVDLGSSTESAAAEALNTRKPGVDTAHKDNDREEDEKSIHERDDSIERQRRRSNDIDNLRQGLLKRQSTRGRRKPGEHLPELPFATGINPSMTLTQASPRKSGGFTRSRNDQIDEENEVGLGSSGYPPQTQTGGLYSHPSQPSQQNASLAQRAQETYSAFPTTSLHQQHMDPNAQNQTQTQQYQGQGQYPTQANQASNGRSTQNQNPAQGNVMQGYSNIPLGGQMSQQSSQQQQQQPYPRRQQ